MKIINICAAIVCISFLGCAEIKVPEFGTESPTNAQGSEGKIQTISIDPIEKISHETSKRPAAMEHTGMNHNMSDMNMNMGAK